jgi:hypothetical protein
MVDDSLTSIDPSVARRGERVGDTSAKWEFFELVAVVILAAQSLRFAGSVVSGVINAVTTHVGVYGEQQLVGSAMERAANFADGPGIVLLLVSLALLWWRAEHWTARVDRSTEAGVHDGALSAEAIQALRLGSLGRWAGVLFTLTALGAASFLIGDILVNTAGGVSGADQWQAYANDGFSVAYLVIALAGLIVSIKLVALCEGDIKRIRAAL